MPLKLNPATCSLDMVMGPGTGTATVQFDIDAATAPGTDPALPTGAGVILIQGAAVAAHSVPVETRSRAANSFNVEVQVAADVTGAPGNTNAAGLAQFDDTAFVVDADGYVTLVGGGVPAVSFTTDVAGPVSPDGLGVTDVTGTSIYSDGTVANTLTLNVQATANTFLVGAGAGVTATEIGPLTNGQLLVGSTGVAPVAAAITAGAGISVTNAAGSITITATGGAFTWTTVTAATQTLAVENGYVGNRGTSITYTLPVTASVGESIQITNIGAGLPIIAQNAGQSINFTASTTTVGVGGSLTAVDQFASMELVCVVTDTTWSVVDAAGSWTIV